MVRLILSDACMLVWLKLWINYIDTAWLSLVPKVWRPFNILDHVIKFFWNFISSEFLHKSILCFQTGQQLRWSENRFRTWTLFIGQETEYWPVPGNGADIWCWSQMPSTDLKPGHALVNSLSDLWCSVWLGLFRWNFMEWSLVIW